MEEILDIQEYMSMISRNNTPPEEIFGRAIRNFYIMENYFTGKQHLALRNNARATIAHLKLLYDYGQQMSLARIYLIHRILEYLKHGSTILGLNLASLGGRHPPRRVGRPHQLKGMNDGREISLLIRKRRATQSLTSSLTRG